MKLSDLAAHLHARLLGDGDLEVHRVCSIDVAGPGDVAFVGHAHHRAAARTTTATAVVVDEGFAADCAHELPCAVLAAAVPSVALRLAIEALHPLPAAARSIAASAVVAGSADVGVDVDVGEGCVIGDGVVVGDGCVIGDGCILRPGVRLGSRVRLGPGCVVGAEGFVFDDDGVAIRPVYGVVIEDDVWIGANTCIDRGLLRPTRIGAHSRIDNLVQIAHDVVIGRNVVIAAMVGVAGYATIGDNVGLAGQAGVNPHVVIADNVRVGGQAGVINDVDVDGAAVSGTPAFAHLGWLKSQARLRGLNAIERRLRRLERATLPPPTPPKKDTP